MAMVRWGGSQVKTRESSGGGQVEGSRWREEVRSGGEVRWRGPGGEEPEKRSGQTEETSWAGDNILPLELGQPRQDQMKSTG